MNSLSSLSAILRMFNFFGLATFSLAVKTSQNPNDVPMEKLFERSIVALVQNLLFFLMISGMDIFVLIQVYVKEVSLYNLSDFFEVFLGYAVAVFILVFYLSRQRVTLNLTSRLYKLYVASDQMNTGLKSKSTFYFITLFIAFQLTLNTIMVVTIFVYHNKFVDLMSTLSRQLIIMWLVTQYALVIRILLDVFRNLNHSLASLTRIPQSHDNASKRNAKNSGSFLFSTKKLQMLLKVRSLHHSLIEICQEVDSFFEFTILACTGYIFVYVIVTSYFLLNLVIEKKIVFDVIEYTHMVMSQVSMLVPLITLVRHATKTKLESNKTGQIIHQLFRGTLNNEITKELNEFSLYLLHARVKFTAWGVLFIDGSLIKSIFGSITTYMVILLQFHMQLSATNTDSDANSQC